jgi:hypothetical protein
LKSELHLSSAISFTASWNFFQNIFFMDTLFLETTGMIGQKIPTLAFKPTTGKSISPWVEGGHRVEMFLGVYVSLPHRS